LLLLLCGCGGEPAVRLSPLDVGDASLPLTADQSRTLAAAEALYRADDPAFAARRDELAKDPVMARWLARLFAYDAVHAFDRRQASDAEFLRQAVGVDPVWDRALAQLRAMGGAAAPCLIDDFLRLRRDPNNRRRLGVTLLGVTGAGSLPAMHDVLTSPDPVMRRLAVLAVGEMAPTPATIAELSRAAADKDFTVRASAYEGLGHALPESAALLRQALSQEADRFVQRVIARALGADGSRVTAQALVAYLRLCLDAHDRAGADAAHEALARLAGQDPRRPRAFEAWVKWAAEQPDRWEVRDGAVEDRPR